MYLLFIEIPTYILCAVTRREQNSPVAMDLPFRYNNNCQQPKFMSGNLLGRNVDWDINDTTIPKVRISAPPFHRYPKHQADTHCICLYVP